MDFSAALQSIKTATDIAKYLKGLKKDFEEAEFNLKIAELMESLANAKSEMAEVRMEMIEKDDQIKELEEALEIKGEVIKNGDAYYLKNEKEEATGEPHCLKCWEGDHKLIHLIQLQAGVKNCPVCRTAYSPRNTPILN